MMFKLAKAKVWHKRLRPKINQFSYKVFYLCFSLKEVPKLSEVTSKFVNFLVKDHGPRDGSSLETWIRGIIEPHGVEADDIILLSYPRVLGYVFNPVSFWYCLKDGKLMAVLAEVNNTFGEGHNYLVVHDDRRPIEPEDRLVAQKDFHVSPFMHVNGSYTFSFGINETNCFGKILHADENGDLLETSVHCKLEELTKKSLRKAFLNSPFMTLLVIMLIHWQALKLFIKRVKYNVKPKQKEIRLTVTKG